MIIGIGEGSGGARFAGDERVVAASCIRTKSAVSIWSSSNIGSRRRLEQLVVQNIQRRLTCFLAVPFERLTVFPRLRRVDLEFELIF